MKPYLNGSVNGRPLYTDFVDAIHVIYWLMVLASPSLYRTLGRIPTREHLLHLMDVYLAYVEHDGRYWRPSFEPVPYERRGPIATKLRAILEQWTPPELPQEIVQAARDLLYCEGQNSTDEERETMTIEGPDPLEDILLWPEGIPALLRQRNSTGE